VRESRTLGSVGAKAEWLSYPTIPAEGRWQDCVDALGRLAKIGGFVWSGNHQRASDCMLEKAKSERQRPPDEYWRRLHSWATKAVEESRYRPTGLAEIRGRLPATAEALEKAGRNTLADDIKHQIATFSQPLPQRALAQKANKSAPPSWSDRTDFFSPHSM
jgi:hypothetical protein